MEEAGREKDRSVVVVVEDLGTATKDTVNPSAKSTRRYPLLSWTTILALIALVGVYIFSVSLKQNGMLLGLKQTDMIEKEREKLCQDPSIPVTEIPYVHYPTPDTYSRKECACTPVRFFAILSMQRSGSGWIETLLNSHENISSNGEIFSIKERRSNITSITKTLDKLYNLDWLSSAAKNECTAAVGLKWMLNQAQILAQFKPEIDTKKLIADLKKSDKLAADALLYFKKTRHIILYYEDVVSNDTKLMDVLDFLRLPKRKLSSRHVKIHTKLLRDHIDNWAEVNSTLMGTQYESFLNG
uniref:Sulfotransferase n=1 Tax=Oryza nivara TaxID=4536 RepID=A0A0E0FU80_ORYNI